MTAPVAWLYAVPYERFFSRYDAMVANIWTFAVVAIWRVLLFSRIVAVVTGVTHRRALLTVGTAAAGEAGIVLTFTAFRIGVFAGMAGLRMLPENAALKSAAVVASRICLVWCVTGFIISLLWPAKEAGDSDDEGAPSPSPNVRWRRQWQWFPFWLLIAAGWILLANGQRPQLENHQRLTDLINGQDFEKAVAFAATLGPEDFPPTLPFPPDMQNEYSAGIVFPETLMALQPSHPAWLRKQWISHLDVLLWRLRDSSRVELLMGMHPERFIELCRHIIELPEGPAWAAANEQYLRAQMQQRLAKDEHAEAEFSAGWQVLVDAAAKFRKNQPAGN